MTAKEKRLRFEGKRITRAEALAGLGDPSTWKKDAEAYAMKIRQPYGSALSAMPRGDSIRERPSRPKVKISSAELAMAAHIIPNMLPSASPSARYALMRHSVNSKLGEKPISERKRAKKAIVPNKRKAPTTRKPKG